MDNAQVAEVFERIADLLELQGENIFRIRAYREAARQIANLPTDIEELWRSNRLQEIPGVGQAIAEKIDELLSTGRLRYLEELEAKFPPGLVEMMRIPGVGPKRAMALFEKLGVSSVDELEQAAKEGRVRTIPGFGAKTEQNILAGIARWRQHSARLPLGRALPQAEQVIELLRSHPAVRRISYAGSLRRMVETIGDIDILVASDRPAEVSAAFTTLPIVREVLAHGSTRASILTDRGLQVDLRVVEPDQWGAALQYFTGSKAHNIKLRDIALRRRLKINEYGIFNAETDERLGGAEEEDIYRALGMAMPPPELREDRGEIEAALAGALPRLVTLEEIRGDLHVHSTWSDGNASIEQMAQAAQAAGLQYIAITDHSQGLGIARGLSPDRVLARLHELRAVQERLPGIRILNGTEVDIRADGSLDYDDSVLATFDWVVASVHSGFNQSREQITQRIIAAMHNPYVDAIGHPSGRIIGQRESYDVDIEAIIKAAVETGTALEINASPDRLDLSDIHARLARDYGAKIVVNTDGHAPSNFAFLRYGVATARRAWLGPEHILNTLPVEELLAQRKCRKARV